MRLTVSLAAVLSIVASIVGGADGEDSPDTLTCVANAKASRDFTFRDQLWTPERTFEMSGPASQSGFGPFALRDKVFIGLNTLTPTVRSLTRYEKEPDEVAEFAGKVVSRTSTAVFLVWTNDAASNKLWSAAIDFTQRRATVAQVYQDVTSTGAEVETLDCR
jgi:hypothetical protein